MNEPLWNGLLSKSIPKGLFLIYGAASCYNFQDNERLTASQYARQASFPGQDEMMPVALVASSNQQGLRSV
jgi:hypothetical protein